MSASAWTIQPGLGLSSSWHYSLRVVFSCALVLFIGLAAPGASLTWLHGGHATPEQAALHVQEMASGMTSHHPGLYRAALGPRLCAGDASSAVVVPDSPQVLPGLPGTGMPTDMMRSALVQPTVVLHPALSERLSSVSNLSCAQHSPSPPHRPPSFS